MSMIVAVGKQGQGKTTCITAHGIDDYERGIDLMPNYDLTLPKARGYGKIKQIDMELLTDVHTELENLSLCLTELWRWLDSRRSGSKRNITMSRLFLQSRKRDMNIYADGQGMSQFDTRFRDNCDLVALCKKRDQFGRHLLDPKAKPPGGYIDVTYYLPGEPYPLPHKPVGFSYEKVGQYFDTREIVEIMDED